MTERESKQRIIQELVPGKQITLAHILANPDASLYQSLGLAACSSAIGIMTVTPPETALIIADIAVKSSGVQIASLDRVSGSLIVMGGVSDVDAAIRAILRYLDEKLGFSVCEMTRT